MAAAWTPQFELNSNLIQGKAIVKKEKGMDFLLTWRNMILPLVVPTLFPCNLSSTPSSCPLAAHSHPRFLLQQSRIGREKQPAEKERDSGAHEKDWGPMQQEVKWRKQLAL
jgi:hypothetical protein